MADLNFADFQLKVLRGIGYSNISTTNRAYQWIKNNCSIDGPCLNYLKSYVSEENFITQKEMNLYKEIINNKQVPVDEEEIDKALSEFYTESGSSAEFSHADISYVENELEKAENQLKELDFTKRLLQRQHNKVQDQINVLKNKNQAKEVSIENILQRSKKVDSLFEDASKKLQNDLIKMGSTFHKLVDEGAAEDEHSIFTINFEIFKKINCTFRNTVDDIINKQFSRVSKSENKSQAETFNELADKEEARRKAEDLVLIAVSLGQRTCDNLMIQCEEAEFNELSKFLDNLKSELNQNGVSPAGIACLQAQTAINNETIEDLKHKSEELQNTLERYHKNNTLQELFTSEKFKLEQKLKCDKKCIRKISDLCSKYIDLITLQACFLENEKENVTLAVDLYNRGVITLQTHVEKHSKAMGNLEKYKNQNRLEKRDNSFVKFTSDLLDVDETNLSIDKVTQSLQIAISDVRTQISSLVGGKLKHIGYLHAAILDLDKIVFNGPSKQPFYIVDLLADKRITELKYVEYNKIYRGFKTKYLEELEKLNNDQYLKMQKLLWIMFLTNPQALQDNLLQLRKHAGVDKNSTMKRTASLFSLADKGSETTKY